MSNDYPGGWRGGVLYDDYATRKLVIQIAREQINGVHVLTAVGGPGDGFETELHENDAAVVVAAMRIPHDIAYALHRILARHYGDGPPGENSRADLLHERGRVDKLIEAVLAPPIWVGGQNAPSGPWSGDAR